MSKQSMNYLKSLDAISFLSVTTGQLDIVRIPVIGQYDWIIPQSLILAINPFHERIWTYIWQEQEVSVYHLLPKEMKPEYIIVIESITDVHRLALQIQGEVSYHSVRIADLKDVEDTLAVTNNSDNELLLENAESNQVNHDDDYILPFMQQDYIFQKVMFQGDICIVPDLDKLSHFLVDLDS